MISPVASTRAATTLGSMSRLQPQSCFAVILISLMRVGLSPFFAALAVLLLFAHHGYGKDIISPSYSWVSPVPYSVVSTNTIRLAVKARDESGGSGIGRVAFFAQYYDFDNRLSDKRPIGEIFREPYELIWDCSRIPDQNFQKLKLSCVVYDRAGNVAYRDSSGRIEYSVFVLDRNPLPKNVRMVSTRSRGRVTVDGDLQEWAPTDSLRFTNNDNHVIAYSQWDAKFLYLAVRVYDRSIIARHAPEALDVSEMANEDTIELFIDAAHTHPEILIYPSRHFVFSAAGKAYESRYTRDGKRYQTNTNLHPSILFAVQRNGSLNNEDDIDGGYTMETALQWKELGVAPDGGVQLGMEIGNSDRDFRKGMHSFAGWTTQSSNLKNPSEWGNLVLAETDRFPLPVAVFVFLLSGGAMLTALLLRKRKMTVLHAEPETPVQLPSENEWIRRTRDIVREQYSDELLTRESVARQVGLTPSYFGKLFLAETGQHFSDYLTDYRVDVAKSLLRNTRKNISEIAFEVGFSSQSYFGAVFKRKVGISPKRYRLDR